MDFAIDFMTDNGMDRTTAGSVMSALGIAELISRVVCAVTGEQKYVSFDQYIVWYQNRIAPPY